MAEFETYRVPATCRDCGEEFETLAFFPTPVKRYGLCEGCAWADKERAKARLSRPDPLAKDIELEPPSRTGEPD